MLVYIISTSYPDKEYPTKNIFVYEQAKELASRGHKIVVLHVKKLPSRLVFSSVNTDISEIDDGFARRYCINQKTILDKKLHLINKLLFVNDVKRLFEFALARDGRPDVIYAHFSCWAGVAASLISKAYGIPLVTVEHFGGLLGNRISKEQKRGIEEVISQSKFFFCVSEGLKQSLEKKVFCSKEIKVIPNMIDRNFHFVPPIEKEEFVFLSIGNLYKEKGFELLINAFCNAFSKNDRVILRIGGGGPEFDKLKSIVAASNRSNQIYLLGRLEREDTIKEYIGCDCFVLASNHETFGMVYREALITGRPIITTDHGGFSGNDWHDCYGYRIPVGDYERLSGTLKTVFERKKQFKNEEISKICSKECSADRVGDLIERYLLESIEK